MFPTPSPLRAWHNFRTGKVDYLPSDSPPVDYSPYIPQDAETQMAYRAYIALGRNPAKAAFDVMWSTLNDDTDPSVPNT